MKNLFKNDLSKHTTMADSVIGYLRQRILSGELAGGSVLKQDALAQQCGVSVSVLREALKTLEGEGFVEFIANKGAFVKRLSAKEAQEIFAVRVILETEALLASLPQLAEKDFFMLENILDEEEFCNDPIRYNDINFRFHSLLYRYCDNERLLRLIKQLNDQVSRYMTIYLDNMLYKDDSQSEHRQLLAACETKDKKAAKAILKKHIQKAGKALADYLDKHSDL